MVLCGLNTMFSPIYGTKTVNGGQQKEYYKQARRVSEQRTIFL